MKTTRIKSVMLIVGVLMVVVGIVCYNLRLYLPEVPVEGVSRKQAYEVIFNKHNSFQFLTNKSGYNWYVYQGNQEGGKTELIKQFNTLGFNFVEQLGSGYIFMRDKAAEQIIVESQMWTGKYIIYQLPNEVKF
ncbi:hypothetical protein [Paenibacillus arenosi]|uniref:Uncharacterized protein n=1 Tax=Paenibacillus arenosi TaxID=2774142 RepID=A0ABR9AT02_9BACL|nr:hypothetical protein [Paenibacillus arenosi]MBD8497252.1 hypothetical protein [Paenibacillus arenosi]